jgi:membrane-associated phospholipid phosphatase
MLLTMVSPTNIGYYFIGVIVLTGAIATARLYLGAHTIKEVYTGFLVGIVGQIVGLVLYHF